MLPQTIINMASEETLNFHDAVVGFSTIDHSFMRLLVLTRVTTVSLLVQPP